MYTRLESAQQKWGGSLTAIDNWLEERQRLIVCYCELAALPPFDKKAGNSLPDLADIQHFCQLLMDYLSAGHFEVYDQIVAQHATNGQNSHQLADALYPKIAKSTDMALEFNDKYAEADNSSLSKNFDRDLSALGQALVERFDFEDELIQTLHTKYTSAVSA
jgi:regulator of sigma D